MKHLFCFLILISLSVSAQKNYVIKYKGNTKQAHSQNKSTTFNLYNNLNRLANNIVNGKYGEAQKAEAIFLWIAHNIGYDHELRFNIQLQKEYYQSKEKIIAKVLHRKKALCGGYAFLFEAMCKQVGIEAKTVHGFTKLTNNYQKPNHSWNAVKVNGRWQLLDLTWSISNGNSSMPDKSWYFTNPEVFIRSHLPEDLNWAFLKNPPSLREFVG